MSLELRVPPPIVALTTAAGMYLLAQLLPNLALPQVMTFHAAIATAMLGAAFSMAGVWSFRLSKTTVNPLRPHKATSLVSTGIYRITRNPMYVGMLLILLGWAMHLASPWPGVGPIAFCLYITRFQIKPEERVLIGLFGPPYQAYLNEVRRWL